MRRRSPAIERASLALAIGMGLTACEATDADELSLSEHDDEYRAGPLPGDCLEPLPPPPGPCTVQVELQSIYIDQGQGISEGDLELRVEGFTNGSPPVTWPGGNAESQRMDVHSGKSISQLVGTHTLGPNQIDVIDVCTKVTEIDNGGLNGQSDAGQACQGVPIGCSMAPRTVELETPLCRGGSSPCKANGRTTTSFRVSISDEDGDGVENDEDMAPTRCSDHSQVLGQTGRAVLVFFHIPDENLLWLVNLAGTGALSGVDIDEAVNDYEYVSLLLPEPFPFHGDPLSPDIVLSTNTITRADYNGEPTHEGFFAALRDIVSKGYDVDIIIIGQGSEVLLGEVPVDAQFETLDEPLTGEELALRLSPEVSGARTIPIRMTYTTASYNDLLVPVWLDAGAKATSGPLQFNFFPDNQRRVSLKWNNGATYNVATSGIEFPSIPLGQVAWVGDNLGLIDSWNCLLYEMPTEECPWDTYLTGEPFPIAEYDETLSPRDNILESSYLDRDGDPTMTKWKTPVTW